MWPRRVRPGRTEGRRTGHSAPGGRDIPGRTSAGLPEGVPHLHKYGSYGGNYHGSGITYGGRPFILVVMTDGAPLAEADAAVARVTASVYRC